MSTRTRIGLVAAAVAIAVVAFIVANPGGSSHKSSAVTRIVVKNAKPVGGIKPITVAKGGRVRFSVTSDVGDEIHVHGYNFHKDVKPGGTISFDFPATIDGQFVIELESRSEQIAALKVTP